MSQGSGSIHRQTLIPSGEAPKVHFRTASHIALPGRLLLDNVGAYP